MFLLVSLSPVGTCHEHGPQTPIIQGAFGGLCSVGHTDTAAAGSECSPLRPAHCALLGRVKSDTVGFLSLLTPHLFWHPSTGSILGVGLVLSLMSHSSQTEARVHVAASLRKLSAYLDGSGDQSRTFQEVGDGGRQSDSFFPFPALVFLLLFIFYFSYFGDPKIKFFLSCNWDKEKT